MALAEPIYTAAIKLRNRRFDAGKNVRRLPKPVISVGNLTAGGTGKTPVVRWLCEELRAAGYHPAVLMRGYKSRGGTSDEQQMLESMLNDGVRENIVVHADPDRYAGGSAVLAAHPGVDVFVLDDGFQHRQLARDFDLVLLSGVEAFGFGHVHPRGLLREPLCGLRRADAVLITRADEESSSYITAIALAKRRYSKAPVFQASHAHVGIKFGNDTLPLDALAGKRVLAFCGIGNPESFFRQVAERAGVLAGSRAFADHHAYGGEDLAALQKQAAAAGAEVLVTTEKDWVKLKSFAAGAIPVWRVEMAVQFRKGDEHRLFELIKQVFQAGVKREP